MGFDIVVSHLKPDELEFCQQALKNYSDFKTTVWHGEQYRLASPYENPFASLMYVSPDKANAIMFSYFHSNQVVEAGSNRPIKLAGLDPNSTYRVSEINLFPGTKSTLEAGKTYSGSFLMNVGINPNVNPPPGECCATSDKRRVALR